MQDHRSAKSDRPRGVVAPAPDEDAFADVKSAVLAKLTLAVGKDPASATSRDWFVAAALTAPDRIIHRWLAADRAIRGNGKKRGYYLSLEFLIGGLFTHLMATVR